MKQTTQVINTTLQNSGIDVPIVINLAHFEEQVNKIALQFRQYRKTEGVLSMTDKDVRLVALASDGMLRSETWGTLSPTRRRELIGEARAQLRLAVDEELANYGQYALLIVLFAGFFEDPFAYYKNSALKAGLLEWVKPVPDDYFGAVSQGVLEYEVTDRDIEVRLYYLTQLSAVLNMTQLMRETMELVRQVREGERPADTFPALGVAGVLVDADGGAGFLPQ